MIPNIQITELGFTYLQVLKNKQYCIQKKGHVSWVFVIAKVWGLTFLGRYYISVILSVYVYDMWCVCWHCVNLYVCLVTQDKLCHTNKQPHCEKPIACNNLNVSDFFDTYENHNAVMYMER